MKVGVIDADLLDHGTRHPNLALMKISGYLQDHGHETSLLLENEVNSCLTYHDLLDRYDKIVISKVFDFSKLPTILQDVMWNEKIMRQGSAFGDYVYKTRGPKIVYGGTGFIPLLNGAMPNHLPGEIEHQQIPDYHLYDEFVANEIAAGKKAKHYDDYRYYSIGFTTRGCFRRCKFCVNRGYQYVEPWSPIEEFYDATRPYIYLWDDNFLGLKDHAKPFEGNILRPGIYQNTWRGILDDLEKTKKPFQFRQGLDIRLMDDEIAERFTSCRYHGDFIFAFDHFNQKKMITRGLEIWKKYHPRGIPKFYVLCGFGDQTVKDIRETFERIRILMMYGALPYIMRHSDYQKSKYARLYVQMARWCNQPQFFKKKSFRQYCETCQEYHDRGTRNKKVTYCSAFASLREFERDYPEVAKQYFDMRWDDLRDTWKDREE